MNRCYVPFSKPQSHGSETVSLPASVDLSASSTMTSRLGQYGYNYPYHTTASTYNANSMTASCTQARSAHSSVQEGHYAVAYGNQKIQYPVTTFPGYNYPQNTYTATQANTGPQSGAYGTVQAAYNTYNSSMQVGAVQTTYTGTQPTYGTPTVNTTQAEYISPQPNASIQNSYNSTPVSYTHLTLPTIYSV